MRIVGGTYREQCAFPSHHEFAGSGMRAAAALAESGADVLLTSAIQESEQTEAEVVAATFGVTAEWGMRTRSVSFSYFTPLNAPVIGGIGSRLQQDIEVSDDVVLAFGLIESGQVKVTGRRVVVDPQRPRNLTEEDLPVVSADQQAWALNEREVRQLAGVEDVRVAAKLLIEGRGLSVVVTKCGPRGALVTTADYQEEVGACVTESVFPIGSGDVFASAFAWAWGEADADPVEAAVIASNAAAHWCETTNYPIPTHVLNGSTRREVLPPNGSGVVYLAGPFFNLQQRWMIDVVKDALSPGVWSPSHEVGPGGLEVAQKDLEGLEHCDSILALLDDSDPGTVFEAGYATKMGIPVVIYAERLNTEGAKMLIGSGAQYFTDLSTAVYKAQWEAAIAATERGK
ncbi:PfkB family carbohydrate kinase [Rhodococcus sp. IEGM 1318]|uniref:PfkB family carbohydrate kinase n=1 Tax=Rhodococcus sp. IEGM 1318 TaxID=3082226 RepID=UPI0029559E5F|nr:PfkB family carbohydrate kinase [Rhodococcus sp. IEGM 1318]MDV8008960.1 PfkB family carbohydrate kinase [Rhodococcus sp. IEGM 1318]